MNAEDKREFEAMFREHAGEMAARFERKVEEVQENVQSGLSLLSEDFKNHVGVLTEDFQHKLDIVIEGHEVLRGEIREVRDESNAKHEQTAFLIQALNDKVDGVENRLSSKIDAVAVDLAAHRKDSEAHGGVWKVKEEGEGN